MGAERRISEDSLQIQLGIGTQMQFGTQMHLEIFVQAHFGVVTQIQFDDCNLNPSGDCHPNPQYGDCPPNPVWDCHPNPLWDCHPNSLWDCHPDTEAFPEAFSLSSAVLCSAGTPGPSPSAGSVGATWAGSSRPPGRSCPRPSSGGWRARRCCRAFPRATPRTRSAAARRCCACDTPGPWPVLLPCFPSPGAPGALPAPDPGSASSLCRSQCSGLFLKQRSADPRGTPGNLWSTWTRLRLDLCNSHLQGRKGDGS